MNKTFPTQVQGFTLIEMTVVLLLMTLLASVAIRETNSLGFQVRYEQTQERLERIKEAILGNPRQIINGQQAVSGFVADMGRLPVSIRELIQLSSYCSDATKLTVTDCENTPGAVWFGRKSYGLCSLNYPNETQCLANAGSWTHLFYGGWNGPYLNISGNPADSNAFTDGWGRLAQGFCSNIIHTNQTACEASAAVWTPSVNDNNYGWYYDTASYTNGLLIQSYGKDHVAGSSDYDADYPAPANQPEVKSQEWLVDISSGVNVNFLKSAEKLPPVSVCTDPAKITKATCQSPETWYGGCSNAGYYNKDSCTAASGAWSVCSDGASPTRSTCESAGEIWFGDGFGCSDQSKPNKALCTTTWRSCTNGAITTESGCLTAGEIWYGDNIFSIKTPSAPQICMKIFYRKSDSSTGVLISDEDITNDATTVNYDPKSIIADGSFQTIRFKNFRDSSNNSLIRDIPIGANAIGIYEHSGTTCTDMHYPADRKNPTQVDFHPRANMPVINW